MDANHANVNQNVNVVAVSVKMSSMIGLVSAHTGNDAVDHYMTGYDFAIGLLVIAGLVIASIWLIKKWKRR